jgi:ArsR family transcriptional regulator, arsenate/arsenite/antimonite-responsive transcriptional repressor
MRTKQDPRFTALDTMLRALADPTRLRIVGLLHGGEVCVCHIHDTLDIPQPKASRHLAYLRRSGIVDTRRDGLWVHYRLASIDDPVVRTLFDSAIHCLGHVDTIARDRKRLEKATGCCPVESTGVPQLACCAT